MLSPVSTWMGDRLGTLGAVGIYFFLFSKYKIIKEYNFLFINSIQNDNINNSFMLNFLRIFCLLDGTACFFSIYFPNNFGNLGS